MFHGIGLPARVYAPLGSILSAKMDEKPLRGLTPKDPAWVSSPRLLEEPKTAQG